MTKHSISNCELRTANLEKVCRRFLHQIRNSKFAIRNPIYLLCMALSLGSGSSGTIAAQDPAAPPQTEQAPPPATPRPSGPATPLAPVSITLIVGRGELVQFADEVSRVSVSDPAIADAVVVSPHDAVLNGKAPGNTTIMIWHGENVSPYKITVEPDLSEIQRQLRATFPSEQIEVSSSKDAILLTGVVSEAEIATHAASIAAVHAKSVVNLIQSPPADSRQVMLQVKFATVDRTNLSQIGANFFSLNNKLVGSATTQQFQF